MAPPPGERRWPDAACGGRCPAGRISKRPGRPAAPASMFSPLNLLRRRLSTSTTMASNKWATPTAEDAQLPKQLISRHVARIMKSIPTAEGQGVTVRRSIGTPRLRNLSPFLMLDHFTIRKGSGFPDHPHRGMVTVTLMLDGYSQHEDFKGHTGTLGPGDMQWMTAGRGIMHAEMPLFEHPQTGQPIDQEPVGLQLWIDLPAELKYSDPSYQEISNAHIPHATPRSADTEEPEREGNGWDIKVISGASHGVISPVRNADKGQCWYFLITLKPGGKVFQPLPTGWNAFIYSLPGAQIYVGDASDPKNLFEPFHTLVLTNKAQIESERDAIEMDRSKQENGVWLTHGGGEQDATFALIAGRPLDQDVYQYGPFVLASRQDVQQTLIDFSFSQNGFEGSRSWKSQIGNVARSRTF